MEAPRSSSDAPGPSWYIGLLWICYGCGGYIGPDEFDSEYYMIWWSRAQMVEDKMSYHIIKDDFYYIFWEIHEITKFRSDPMSCGEEVYLGGAGIHATKQRRTITTIILSAHSLTPITSSQIFFIKVSWIFWS